MSQNKFVGRRRRVRFTDDFKSCDPRYICGMNIGYAEIVFDYEGADHVVANSLIFDVVGNSTTMVAPF